jgi:ATP synthase F1 delta subunit
VRAIIAYRYAKALFALAKTGPTQLEWEKQLRQIAGLLDTEEKLRKMLLHPAVALPKKQDVLRRLAAQLDAAEAIKPFLDLLVQRNRLQALHVISVAFGQLVDQVQGRQPILVQTAHPLSDHESKKLQEQLESVLKKQVELEQETNPDLVGGIVFQLGSLRYDGSVHGQLARLRKEATKGV